MHQNCLMCCDQFHIFTHSEKIDKNLFDTSKVTSRWPSGFGDGYLCEKVLPPANIHTALHSLLQGQPQRALLPLLASKQAPCVQRTCDMLELYTLLSESTAACSQILAQSSVTQAADSASRVGVQSAASRRDSTHAELSRSAIQEGAQKLVLAMVHRVRPPAHVANLNQKWHVALSAVAGQLCCCFHSAFIYVSTGTDHSSTCPCVGARPS